MLYNSGHMSQSPRLWGAEADKEGCCKEIDLKGIMTAGGI